MPPAGPFLSGQKGAKEPVKAGDSDFPRLNNPPLETAKKGELRFPLLGVSPEPSCWRLSDGGGLRCNAPSAPDGLAYPPFLGGTSNRGAAAPLIGRFKGWGVGAGEIGIPRPDPSFPPLSSARKRGRRRHDKKADTKMVSMEGAPARHKAGRCGQRVNCPRGAREAAMGRRPLPGGGEFRGRGLGRKKALSSPSTGRKRLLSWCHPCSERNSAPSVLLLREGDHTRLRARW